MKVRGDNKTKQFDLVSDYQPAGDQPQAIRQLVEGMKENKRFQILQGVTGSGKTFTLANMIARINRPVLVLSHNKTLAAQLYSEFKNFFPNNAVEYFVSYYDYYQPEVYLPQTDTYIAKDTAINEELDKLRLAATSSLIQRRDVIVVCSVSCIYGLGSPEDFEAMQISLEVGAEFDRDEFLHKLVEIQYERNDYAPERGKFRVSGDTIDIFPSYRDEFLRVAFWGDEVESLSIHDRVTGNKLEEMTQTTLFPAKHFVISKSKIDHAKAAIMAELQEQVRFFEQRNRMVEAQRIWQRTCYDLEMLSEIGYCQGIENYSRHLAGRPEGERPMTLLDYFPDDFVTIIDESHVTIPQIRAMYNADRNRKLTLIENGFRLPSALDNRPLNFAEFESIQRQVVFVSATPAVYELSLAEPILQIIRPTGLLDPIVEVRPLAGQVDDVIAETVARISKKERVLITTLTKKTAEDLSDYLRKLDIKARYLHSSVDTIERVDIIRALRNGEVDCLVGVNLLREGLDLPEVSLVAILDADKEGFLRSETSLIQTAGRTARHKNGTVILYADRMTGSMQRFLDVTTERRKLQEAYNAEHHIEPKSVARATQYSLRMFEETEDSTLLAVAEDSSDYNLEARIAELEAEMQIAADSLNFEKAILLRDKIAKLKKKL